MKLWVRLISVVPPVAAALLSFSSSIPYNTLSPPAGAREELTLVLPEGWAFFTRNPREERQWPLFKVGASWVADRRLPFSRAWVPISRDRRAIGIDLARLVDAANSDWVECGDLDVELCLEQQVAVEVSVDSNFLMCGDVAIVTQAPRPWAWANLEVGGAHTLHAIRFSVECSDAG